MKTGTHRKIYIKYIEKLKKRINEQCNKEKIKKNK